MDIAIQLKKRNLEMIDHRQHVLGGTYILDKKMQPRIEKEQNTATGL